METVREVQKKTERTIENNHRTVISELESLRVRITYVEDQINGFKKQIAILDDKMRGMGKAAAMSGNAAMAGNVIEDLESGLAQLRKEFE